MKGPDGPEKRCNGEEARYADGCPGRVCRAADRVGSTEETEKTMGRCLRCCDRGLWRAGSQESNSDRCRHGEEVRKAFSICKMRYSRYPYLSLRM
jgi:hypothetical protein